VVESKRSGKFWQRCDILRLANGDLWRFFCLVLVDTEDNCYPSALSPDRPDSDNRTCLSEMMELKHE
jgi:hypothetical protein